MQTDKYFTCAKYLSTDRQMLHYCYTHTASICTVPSTTQLTATHSKIIKSNQIKVIPS